MKKIIAVFGLICVLGLSGCGKEAYTELEQVKGEKALNYAEKCLLPYMVNFFDDEELNWMQQNCNVHEVKYITEQSILDKKGVEVDVKGSAILNGMVSFHNTYDSLGDLDENQTIKGSYKISGDEIIVSIPVKGTKKDSKGNIRTATAEFIFSNDIFLTVESCALNLDQSIGELMAKAAMDTLMGMATVFSILILISIIIAVMGNVTKGIENASKKKKEKKQDIKTEAVNNTIAQIIEKEEQQDNTELIAVIAAAIAAYEGSTSADGYVVRSIRKRR